MELSSFFVERQLLVFSIFMSWILYNQEVNSVTVLQVPAVQPVRVKIFILF